MTSLEPADIFLQEAQELMEQLEQDLLELAQTPDDHERVDSAFRALHTLKGSGAMFGFEDVAKFIHDFETTFDRVRKGFVPCNNKLVVAALEAKDHIRILIETPDKADRQIAKSILESLRTALDETPEQQSVKVDQETVTDTFSACTTWRVHMRFAQNLFANGTNPLFLFDELKTLGDCKITAIDEAVPSIFKMDAQACYFSWEAILKTELPKSTIEEVFIFALDEMELLIEPLSIEVANCIQNAETPNSEVVPAASQLHDVTSDAPSLEQVSLKSTEPKDKVQSKADGKPNSSLRVSAERLDELMDRVGELVIAQARLSQLASASHDLNIRSLAEEIERLAAGLRDTTMSIRMVPIGTLFGRFRRLVHDLSRDLGKDVELMTFGEETELDKTMIEQLADPLVHIIRNAIDHGLEPADIRQSAGKSSRGRIRLVARHSGAEVLISVIDDGRGLDAQRIRRKAEEQGLLEPQTQISDQELYQFLFHPGFSTAEKISTVSGRGVGMDVVKRTIEGLRGSIDVVTTLGRGTEFTLRLPLTLAIIEGLLVAVGGGRYAIPLSAVEECVELSVVEDTRSNGRSFLNIRSVLVPFLRLRDLFQVTTEPDPHQKIVIVSSGDLRVGFIVDQIIGSHQTVIKSLSKLQADAEFFSGATILGDGTVALILDVVRLIESAQSREERSRNLVGEMV
jgi:two-component system chemotaxis sensor kinase CheA